jgi:flagellar biosynthetic protein FliR
LDFITFGAEKLQTFLLVSFRAAGLFLISPVIGHVSIPPLIKAALAVILALLLIPAASQTGLPEINSLWVLGLLAAKEMLVGFIIGLFFAVLFVAVRMAGNIVGYQIGLIIANVLDPDSHSEISVVGEFWYVISILIFLAIEGHHALISAFGDSYKIVPVGTFNFTSSAADILIRFSALAFVIAIKIAAPVIVTLFLTEVALGVVARTLPQMNIFIVGIPLKIVVGFLILAAALPVFRFMVEKTVHLIDGDVTTMLSCIGTT